MDPSTHIHYFSFDFSMWSRSTWFLSWIDSEYFVTMRSSLQIWVKISCWQRNQCRFLLSSHRGENETHSSREKKGKKEKVQAKRGNVKGEMLNLGEMKGKREGQEKGRRKRRKRKRQNEKHKLVWPQALHMHQILSSFRKRPQCDAAIMLVIHTCTVTEWACVTCIVLHGDVTRLGRGEGK